MFRRDRISFVFILFGIPAGSIASSCRNGEDDFRKSEEATGDNLKVKLTKTVLRKTSERITAFRLEQNQYPEYLEDLVVRPEFVPESKWPRGGYMSSVPRDGWDNELVYEPPGESDPRFALYALGKDGQPGGEGYDADITYEEAGR